MMLWTFGKVKARISLGRQSQSSVLIVVRACDQMQEYRFPDASSLRVFQADMEAFLLKTGWTLLVLPGTAGSRPGSGVFRLAERRRWWTDTKERANVVWGRHHLSDSEATADPKDNFPASSY